MMRCMKYVLLWCVFLVIAGCSNKNADTESVVYESEMDADNLIVETEKADSDVEMLEEQESMDVSEASDLPAVSDPNGIEYESLPDDIKGMLIPIDSLLLYNVEIGGEYKPEDPEMFWQTMHYMFGNFGEFYNRAEFRESELAVQSMDAAEFATSFVADFKELPQVPESLNYGVRYDVKEDVYFFGVGDRGLSSTEILSYEYMDSNTLKITARLFAADDDSTIRKGAFTLVRNDYAAGVIEPLFYFSVSEAEFSVE